MHGYNSIVENLFTRPTIANNLGLGEQGSVISKLDSSCFLLCPDEEYSIKLGEQLTALSRKNFVITNFDKHFTLSTYSNQDNKYQLLTALYLMTKDNYAIVTTAKALTSLVPNKDRFIKNILHLSKIKEYELNNVEKTLIAFGYKKTDLVATKGEYSRRGDILDIFPINEDNPVRLDFFDTQLEMIYSFDFVSFEKIKNLDSIDIIPSKLLVITEEEKVTLIKKLSKHTSDDNIFFELISMLELGQDIPLEYLTPFFDDICTLYQFIDKQAKIIINELLISVSYEKHLKQLNEKFLSIFKNDELIKIFANNEKNLKIFEKLSKVYENLHKNLLFFNNSENFKDLEDKLLNIKNINFVEKINFNSIKFTDYLYRLDALQLELGHIKDKQIFLCLESEDTLKSITKIFTARNIAFSTNKNSYGIILTTLNIPYNICFADEEKLYIGSRNFAHKKLAISQTKTNVKYLPKAGEHVVHSTHGIGKCEGVVNVEVAGVDKEFFRISYRGGDILYVPTENTDCLSLYLSDGNNFSLNKLGGKDFAEQKARVQKSIEDMGKELLELYAKRKSAKGFKYNEDDYLYTEFENAFPYNETADQISAINDIKNDMHSGKVMDRLICGDVGYGKTEVAMRALFKTIESGKQVAILAPTTILSLQHYMSILERTKDFGISVEMLNRFKSKKEQDEIIKDLISGKLNVICGTHRLLSSDVKFNDLGLLILDEEQRFGVKAKEHIKEIKNNINVLTLSATPIPRTLSMAMMTLRDISIINTPPKDRLPVKTYVMGYNEDIVIGAIKDEISRGGQVLIVYNNIDKIYTLTSILKEKLNSPIAKFDVAHGQMSEVALENAIKRLYDRETNVFVSTTLIENGIDLPKANTLIVLESDRLGLSQMYQLRGRVGRNTEQAYAYFTYSKDKALTEEASSRLEAIAENTELGSGFKIAMRDLSIRGAGSLLGKVQHGHLIKIGYDMYIKLLNETMRKLKGEKLSIEREIKIDIAISSKIPGYFLSDESERLKIYAKISNIASIDSQRTCINDLLKIYGKLPKEILQLATVSLLKVLGVKQNIKQIIITKSNMSVTFYQDINIEKLLMKVKNYNKFKFVNTNLPTIKLDHDEFNVVSAQNYILSYLKDN